MDREMWTCGGRWGWDARCDAGEGEGCWGAGGGAEPGRRAVLLLPALGGGGVTHHWEEGSLGRAEQQRTTGLGIRAGWGEVCSGFSRMRCMLVWTRIM